MVTIELINQLVLPNNEAKQQIEQLLKEAYIGIQNLHKMSLDKSLTLEYVEEVENLFIENRFNPEDLNLPKYLQKYAQCLSDFFESYTYYFAQRSRGKFNLFRDVQKGLLLNIYFESDCAYVLRKLEDYWIASNQVYTKYEISLIRKEYLR